MPTLSIVIPVYNMGYWLPVAIESCLWQSHKNIELIIINDGSTDNTQEVIEKYSKITDRLVYYTQSNKGSGTARQIGQNLATGDFITWIDADDFLAPNAAEQMLKIAIEDNVPLVCGNAVTFSDKTLRTRAFNSYNEAHKLRFCKSPNYWENKTIGRWIFSLPFLRMGRGGRPFIHPNFKLSLGSICFMFDVLSSNAYFSQCVDEMYFIRQEHKYTMPSPELLVEQKLTHYLEIKDILLDANAIKPFIHYLNKYYWTDLQITMPNMYTQNIRWLNHIIEISLNIFADLSLDWFTENFLQPETNTDPALLPFAEACITKDKKKIKRFLLTLAISNLKTHSSPNNQGLFQTFRNEISSLFYNRSKRTKNYLQLLEKNVRTRTTLD